MNRQPFIQLEQLLAQGIVIGDGAMGTELQAMSGAPLDLPEGLALDENGRESIRRAHRRYLEAGAQILETNTFAANPLRLESFALADQCERIIAGAVRIAKSVAGGRALVAGAVGPLDLGLSAKDMSSDLISQSYRRQIQALAENGVDLIMLETFASPDEARLALAEAEATKLPVFFSIGGQTISRPYARRAVEELIALANQARVQVVGINCLAPYDLSRVLPAILRNTRLPVLAYPNAGTPSVVRGKIEYDCPIEVLIAEAQNWRNQGVSILGGCCGTGPQHIAALSEHFARKPVMARATAPATITAPAKPRETIPGVAKSAAAANPVRRKLGSTQKILVAVEVRPALNHPLAQTVASVCPIAESGADFFDVPDNAGANPGRDCMACGALLQQAYPEIPAIVHKTATQTNALHLHSYLLGAADLGVRGVLALTGDPPHVGTFDRFSSRIHDVRNSVELLRLIGLLRAGTLMNGQPFAGPVDFAAGCAFAPTNSLKNQVQWLRKKIEAGAEYAFTQPIFDFDDFQKMREALADIDLPIFTGILPLVSAQQAIFLQSGKIPGMNVPTAAVKRVADFSDAGDQAKAGIALAQELIGRTAGLTRGLYLIMPFHKKAISFTAELVGFIRTNAPSHQIN